MGYGTEESIFINDDNKTFFVSNKYRNKEFKGCRKISNLNLGPLTHEVSELKKAGYEKKYFKDFEVLMIEK